MDVVFDMVIAYPTFHRRVHFMKREEALELLQHQHTFPGPFDFRVVVRSGTQTQVMTAMTAAAGEGARVSNVTSRPSKKGTYEALVIRIEIASAERVLQVYDMVQSLPEVVTAM